ncbi:iron transporter FeoA [Paraliobacillus quinghaiensis]|uniref:Iron transporter FeoA n=1 Tax=Paraliobacillus quinghaiensis TaxID=470815 RepID=A0A917TEA6_9BACI|nr:FeoA family protein [Paraliobacillus quinghaiensis]GGM19741.1 iron transporter FeoA [Paraliobacillus quinghaiensis]
MLLSELSNNDIARVTDFSKVHIVIQKRLRQLGIKQDCEVCLIRKLPFGGPCMLESSGQCISLRLDEARLIEVQKK